MVFGEFLYITYIFRHSFNIFFFLLVFYPIILGINLALTGLIYIIFMFIKNIKLMIFNTILSLTFAISLSFLVSLIF